MNLNSLSRYLGILSISCGAWVFGAEKPNILWITAEDMSANLGCYGDAYANTQILDRFARQSVRYTQAFATAPVCSPARSTLITGCYATSLGTQRLRSEFPISEKIRGFPSYLREGGYFTSNNVKTDYNIAEERAFIARNWDRNASNAHWRQRESGRPFFSVFNLMTTHQSRANVWPWEQFEKEVAGQLSASERHDPDKAPLPPYYPDTPLVGRTVARYYDCITVMDKQVGVLLRQLEEDGLTEDTIVFFYSDHGMGMPRGKRLLHDSGMRIPMLIRFPEKWRHWAPSNPGDTTDRLVSFVDFAPTVLNLAGVRIPDYMQGIPFLGEAAGTPRQFVYGARDRVDEVFDLSRSVRDDRFLLIENYMPHLSWMPPERYSDNAEMRRELKALAVSGKLNAPEMTYAAPTRAPIEFYDVRNDPHQIHNLADRPEHRTRIQSMSGELHKWQQGTADLGCFTEPMIWRLIETHQTPWDFGRSDPGEIIRRGWDAARQVLRPHNVEVHLRALASPDSVVRYWGALERGAISRNVPAINAALKAVLSDDSPSVRIEAAFSMLRTAPSSEAMRTLVEGLNHPTVEVRLHAMRSLELLGAKAQSARREIEAVLRDAVRKEPEHPSWMFVRFSAEAALEALGASPR